MKNILVLALAAVLSIFIAGCVNVPGAGTIGTTTSHNITFTTGAALSSVAILPAATAGEQYGAAITPSGGVAPYSCQSVPAGSFIAGTIALLPDCAVSGTAPELSAGTDEAVYQLKFMINDSNGTSAGPFTASLEILPAQQAAQPQQGQGGQQGTPSAPAPGGAGQQAPPVPAGNQTTASQEPAGCPSPYDGTWQGTMADSGTLLVSGPQGGSQNKPFTASYQFGMTLQCADDDGDNGIPGWDFYIPNATASDPLFNCTNGCATQGDAFIADNGSGNMMITFPDGMQFIFVTLMTQSGIGGSDVGLQVSPDGKTMELYFDGTPDQGVFHSIGSTPGGLPGSPAVENEGCSGCMVWSINPYTVTLTRVG